MRNEQADKDIRGWFKEHKASLCVLNEGGRALWWLRWKKPGTTIYWIDYVMTADGRLMVTGDVGDAIYQWYFGHLDGQHRGDPLAFVSGCDLGYFASKCVASETGRRYTEWSEEKAHAALEAWVRDGEGHEEREALLAGEGGVHWFADDSPWYALDTESDWREWLRCHGADVFGDEWWREWCDIGREVHIRSRSHLIGLKMAMEQIKEKEHVEPA